jgi:hypothetical protein
MQRKRKEIETENAELIQDYVANDIVAEVALY